MTCDAVAAAAAVLGDVAVRDEPLGPLTTYRVGGAAALFVRATSLKDLHAVAAARRVSGLPLLIVGKGSNLLVADRGFAGIAVSVADLAGAIDLDPPCAGDGAPGPDDVDVIAGGGVALPVLARRTASAALTGFEWAVGVPGTVGGGVRMNAGGHGSDMAACLVSADIFDFDEPDPTVRSRDSSELAFRFRGSGIGDHALVVSARLRLQRGDRATSEATIGEIVRWRRENQPGGQNCGSVFINPLPGEIASARLIDRAGLRGLRVGTAAVSDKHVNFVQASEGGSANDVRAVIEAVRARVAETAGFVLHSEVRLVGFEDSVVADTALEDVAQ